MLVRRIARPMIAALFVVQGLEALRHPGKLAERSSPLLDKVVPMLGLPDDKEMLVRANAVTQIVGGALVASGRLPRLGAALLAGSLVPTTLAGHAFWDEKDPVTKKAQRIHFLKNVSMLGGLLITASDTAGKPGLAWRAQNAGRVTQREAKHALHSTAREARIARQGAQIKVQDALS
ncbi:DoxX family protein [Lapillicoccus sp.]|uniref:DoxX family protein n=1 Tax=Lapillicoccus sp. TaxID=1909287 RepID=UPI0032662C67